jgi:hypothetical protein
MVKNIISYICIFEIALKSNILNIVLLEDCQQKVQQYYLL